MVSTGKVGDTINAKVEPADATDPTFAWAADGTPILGATTASYVVGEADLGKKISVTVTGCDGKTFTAETEAVKAAEGAALTILSAEQTGSATIAVKFTAEATSSDKLTVARAGKDIEGIVVELDAGGLGATITMPAKIGAAEYTVTLTPADTAQKATTASFTGKIAELKEIRVLSENLVMSDTSYKKGFVYVKGYDDFGDEVILSGLTVTPSIGAADYKASSGLVTVYADPNKNTTTTNSFLLTPTVVLTATYQSGTTVLTKSASLTVSAQAYVASIEFGEIATTSTTKREDGQLTIDELATSKYYIPVSNVKDQYENALDADRLNDMINTNSGGSNNSGTLYITPNTSATQYFAFKEFGTLKDGTIVAYITSGNGKPGTCSLQVTSVGGGSFSKEVTVVDNPFIQSLTVSVPELYLDTAAEVTFTAVDQYGDNIDLYNFAPAPKTGNTNVLEFADVNNLTNQKTTVTMTTGQAWSVTKNTSKKTFTVKVTPGMVAGAKPSNIVFTTATAGLETGTQTVTVSDQATPESIGKTLKATGTDEAVVGGQNPTFKFADNLSFYDTSSAVVAKDAALYPEIITTIANGTVLAASKEAGVTYSDYEWIITTSEISAGTLSAAVTGLPDGVGAGRYYVTLIGRNSGSTKYVLLDSKKFTITAADTTLNKVKSWTASVKADSVTGGDKSLLFVGKDSKDAAYIKLEAKDANSNVFQVAVADYYVTVEKGLTASGQKITGSDNALGTGSAVVHVWVDTDNDKVAEDVAQTTVAYDVAASKAEGIKLYNKDDKVVSTADEITGVADIALVDGILNIDAGKEYTLSIYDQYGMTMSGTVYTLNGKAYAAGTTLKANTSYPLAASYKGLESRNLTVTIGGTAVTTKQSSSAATKVSQKVAKVELTGSSQLTSYMTTVSGTPKITVFATNASGDYVAANPTDYYITEKFGDAVVGHVLGDTAIIAGREVVGVAATGAGVHNLTTAVTADGTQTQPGTYTITVTSKDDVTQTKSVTISVGKAASFGTVNTTAPTGNFAYNQSAKTGTLSSWVTEAYKAATYNLYYSSQAMTTSNFATVGNKIGELKKKDSDNTATAPAFTITNESLAATAAASASGYYAVTVVPDSAYYEDTTETFKACSAALVGQLPVLSEASKITSIVVGNTDTTITAQVYPRAINATLSIVNGSDALTVTSQTLNGSAETGLKTKNASETLETWVFTVANNDTHLTHDCTLKIKATPDGADSSHTAYTESDGKSVGATQVLSSMTLGTGTVNDATAFTVSITAAKDQFNKSMVVPTLSTTSPIAASSGASAVQVTYAVAPSATKGEGTITITPSASLTGQTGTYTTTYEGKSLTTVITNGAAGQSTWT